MKSLTFFLLFCLSFVAAQAQLLPLDSCISWAYSNQKFTEEATILQDRREIQVENENKGNLPGLALDGSATIQNENISIPIGIPGIEAPDVPINFNRLLVDFSQTIYNGGLAAHKKILRELEYKDRMYDLDIRKSRIKASVTSVYSGIVLTRTHRAILEKQNNTLQAKLKNVEGAVSSGVVLKSNFLALKAEQLKVDQEITENRHQQAKLRRQLRLLTGREIPSGSVFRIPDVDIDSSGVESRPEFLQLENTVNMLDARKKLGLVARSPVLGIFGSAGFGLPGYDIFNNSVRPMVFAGIQLKWKIVDWDKVKNENQLLSLNQSLLGYQQHRLNVQLSSNLENQLEEIRKIRQLIVQDKEILTLRREVAQQLDAQLRNGTATSADYIRELNAAALAELTGEIHKIQLKLAKLNYAIIQGN